MAGSLSQVNSIYSSHAQPNRLRFLVAGVLAFSISYNITFRAAETLTSGRVAVIVMMIWWLFSREPSIFRRFDWRALLVFLPLPYVILQLILVGDFGQASRFFHLAFYSYLGGLLISQLVDDLRGIFWIFLISASVQALFLIYSFVDIGYRAWLDATVITGGNFDVFNMYRAPGFTSNAGASLSFVQSLGVLNGGFLLMGPQKINSRLQMWCVLGLMILCSISCSIVGRTGLFLSLLFIFLTAIYARGTRKLIFSALPIFLVLLYFVLPAAGDLISPDVSIDWLVNWMLGIFSEDDQTFSALASMPIPPIDQVDSWVGRGLVSIIDGVNPSGHDSGFVQAYYSMGLFFSAILFAAYFYVLVRLLSWLPPTLKWLLVFIFFSIEIKEPFLFKYALMFMLVAIYPLTKKMTHQGQRP